jgi:hypothetical protein
MGTFYNDEYPNNGENLIPLALYFRNPQSLTMHHGQ